MESPKVCNALALPSDQRIFALKRTAALSKDGFMFLDEGPRTVPSAPQRRTVLLECKKWSPEQ